MIFTAKRRVIIFGLGAVLIFLLGFLVGKPRVERCVERTSMHLELELQKRVDSLLRIVPDTPDTIYTEGAEFVILHPSCYVSSWTKFAPKKTFENYIVPGKFKGKIPPLNFSTCKWGKQFITRTKQDIADTAEFAGYYAFASWGCGSPCQMCSVIDLRNGNVYAGPYASGGYEYRANSRILIVNPPEPSGYYCSNTVWPPPEQYLWTGTSFKRLE